MPETKPVLAKPPLQATCSCELRGDKWEINFTNATPKLITPRNIVFLLRGLRTAYRIYQRNCRNRIEAERKASVAKSQLTQTGVSNAAA